MTDKMLIKIANSQAFLPEDKLGEMLDKYINDNDELAEDGLDLVFAARKNEISYDDFIKHAENRKKTNQL